jgi:hypothetical protein
VIGQQNLACIQEATFEAARAGLWLVKFVWKQFKPNPDVNIRTEAGLALRKEARFLCESYGLAFQLGFRSSCIRSGALHQRGTLIIDRITRQSLRSRLDLFRCFFEGCQTCQATRCCLAATHFVLSDFLEASAIGRDRIYLGTGSLKTNQYSARDALRKSPQRARDAER